MTMLPLSRRKFLKTSSLMMGTLAGTRMGFAQSNPEFAIAETKFGRVRGSRSANASGSLITFKGIPYGGSVSGANRFKAAPDPTPWKGVRDALRLGATSIQNDRVYVGVNEPGPA